MSVRQPLDGFATGVMLMLCVTWGLQQTAIKVAAPVIAPVMQVAMRSAVAALLLLLVLAVRRIGVSGMGATLSPGLLAGVLFALEFLCVALGLGYTTAARMSVFLYTAPIFTALGLHLFVAAERLDPRQWGGVALAFVGVAVAFSDGWLDGAGLHPQAWIGDAFGVAAGALWGMTTVVIRASRLSEAPPSHTLLYQLGMAALVLYVFARVTHTHGIGEMTPLVWGSLAFQSIVVTFGSYLVWFWLLRRYLASRLSVFSFLTPVFGIAAGVWLLDDPFAPAFGMGAACILAGIALVNLPRQA